MPLAGAWTRTDVARPMMRYAEACSSCTGTGDGGAMIAGGEGDTSTPGDCVALGALPRGVGLCSSGCTDACGEGEGVATASAARGCNAGCDVPACAASDAAKTKTAQSNHRARAAALDADIRLFAALLG